MLPAMPHRLVRLRNQHGTRTEAYYGLKPGLRATYYFWVEAANGKTRFTTLEVPTMGKVRAGRQWDLRSCHDYEHKSGDPNFADADLLSIDQKVPVKAVGGSQRRPPQTMEHRLDCRSRCRPD
jgi:hypothetical protein